MNLTEPEIQVLATPCVNMGELVPKYGDVRYLRFTVFGLPENKGNHKLLTEWTFWHKNSDMNRKQKPGTTASSE